MTKFVRSADSICVAQLADRWPLFGIQKQVRVLPIDLCINKLMKYVKRAVGKGQHGVDPTTHKTEKSKTQTVMARRIRCL